MRRVALLLVPLLLLACDRQPAAPAVDDGPSFNWMNNPDIENLQIHRFMDHYAVSWTDPKTGLRATHTTYPIGDEPDCSPQGLLDDLVDLQDVGIYEDDFLTSRIRSMLQGEDVWLIVRDVTQAGDCYGNALVGQGTARIRGTDNDVLAWYPVFETGEPSLRNNNNAYGWSAHGNLTTVGGEVLQYNGHFREVWDPQNSWYDPITDELYVHVLNMTAKVNLH